MREREEKNRGEQTNAVIHGCENGKDILMTNRQTFYMRMRVERRMINSSFGTVSRKRMTTCKILPPPFSLLYSNDEMHNFINTSGVMKMMRK